MSATQGPYESKSLEEEKSIEGYASLQGGSVIKSGHSKGPSDGGSPDENTSDVKFDITIDRKGVTLKDLPQFGGQDAVAYGNVTMPAKLYGVKGNIQSFIESKLVDDWNITKLWTGWLKQVVLNTVISKKQVRLQVSEELEPQMETVGNSGQLQISFSTDRVFLHLLVGTDDFKYTSSPDLTFYMKESHCYTETVRFIKKFVGKNEIDTDVIEKFWNPRPNRRFSEIVIFISQFFGRAERVMEESKVKELWKTLLFLNDFVKALEEQSKISQEKQTKQHAEDTTIKKEKKVEGKEHASSLKSAKQDNTRNTNPKKRKHQESKETGSEERGSSKVANTEQTTESVAPLVSTDIFVSFVMYYVCSCSHNFASNPSCPA
jgi:hypothetical protein